MLLVQHADHVDCYIIISSSVLCSINSLKHHSPYASTYNNIVKGQTILAGWFYSDNFLYTNKSNVIDSHDNLLLLQFHSYPTVVCVQMMPEMEIASELPLAP
jgi:hypothetical protein